MTTRPSITDIGNQIAALKAIKPKVRRTSLFGDNLHDAIDAQIEVLENNLSEDEIDSQWGLDFTAEEDAEGNSSDAEYQSAMEARRWLDGEEMNDGPDPVSGWKSLVRE